MKINSKENLLRAIYFEDPEYVPRTNEEVVVGFQFEGNFEVLNIPFVESL